MKGYILSVLLGLGVVSGCSVKEDRTECPCRLMLDFQGVDTSLVKEVSLFATMHGEMLFMENLKVADVGGVYERDVPHGIVRVNVWSGEGVNMEKECGILIPYGCECPPVYMYSFLADTSNEICYGLVDMRKNHCRLTVRVEGKEQMPYSLTFKGNVGGYGLDGLPSKGDFSCVAYPSLDGQSHALLPRQLDSSLLLEVDDDTSLSKTFAVGEYIASSGYDWEAEDLEDITVVLDYYITKAKITVKGWDKEYDYDIIL